MANILKDDVQTYVRGLIETAFESNRVEGKDQLGNQPFFTEEPQKEQHRPICYSSRIKE